MNLPSSQKSEISIKVKGKISDYFVNTAYPQVPYQVFKNGILIKTVNLYQCKGQFYSDDLEQLLKAMGIKYCSDKSKGITYVGYLKPIEIKGRLLAQTKLEFNRIHPGNGIYI